MLEIFPFLGILIYAVAASSMSVFTGTVITKVSVGQLLVCPGAQTVIIYVYVPASVAVKI